MSRLLLHLAQLPAQPDQLLTPGAAQNILAANGLGAVSGRLRDSSRNTLRAAVELTRTLRGRAASLYELDHLSAEFRRVRGLRDRHIGLLLP
ncbi:MAG: hypothetical protein ABI330_07845 [Caldimonas sp.]